MAGEHFVYNPPVAVQVSDVGIWVGCLDAILALARVLKVTTDSLFPPELKRRKKAR